MDFWFPRPRLVKSWTKGVRLKDVRSMSMATIFRVLISFERIPNISGDWNTSAIDGSWIIASKTVPFSRRVLREGEISPAFDTAKRKVVIRKAFIFYVVYYMRKCRRYY